MDDNTPRQSAGEVRCPTYAFVLRNGFVYCEQGDACPILDLRDQDVQAFLDGHVAHVRLDRER
jgi:hypothetical protein